MNLTQRQLRLFVTTANLGHVSRAAEALHVSQPALTRALAVFEQQMDMPLFARTTRRLSLTPQGERFLPLARRLLQDMDDAVLAMQPNAAGLQGSVTLAVGAAFGATVLPGVLQSFVRRYPGVRVCVLDDNSEGITRRVRQGEADLGIGSPVGDINALHCHHLLSAPLGLLADPAHFQLVGTTPEQLLNVPLLKEGADTSIMQALRVNGSPLVTQMAKGVEVSSLGIQLALARAGVGVAVLSALGASHRDAQGMVFTPLEPTVRRELFLLQRRDRITNPAATAMAQNMVQHLANGLAGLQLRGEVSLPAA